MKVKTQNPNIENELLCTLKNPFDTFGIFVTRSISVTLSFTGNELIIRHLSTRIACGLTNGTKTIYEAVMQKHI